MLKENSGNDKLHMKCTTMHIPIVVALLIFYAHLTYIQHSYACVVTFNHTPTRLSFTHRIAHITLQYTAKACIHASTTLHTTYQLFGKYTYI